MKFIDGLLNRVTMYRLVLYVLIGWLTIATIFGQMGRLPFSGLAIAGTTLFIVGVTWLTNRIFAWAYGAPPHDDSAYITALILALIISPLQSSADLGFIFWAPVLAMAGKYIFAIRRQHIANPAALAVLITSVAIHGSASWWIGTPIMTIPVVLGGLLIVRKIRRGEVVMAFLLTTLTVLAMMTLQRQNDLSTTLSRALTSSAMIFFATVMLTEPLTMPPTRRWRFIFAVVIGILYVPQVHLGAVYFSPELALVIGNVAGWLMFRRQRLELTLLSRVEQSPTIMDFVFSAPNNFSWRPGQYFEWIVPHGHSDQRGQRRYFTIASAPTEGNIRIGVKFYSPMSRYKEELLALPVGRSIIASQLDGDFTLPHDPKKKLVFIAGGIGVTPFRSMIKAMLDRKDARVVTMFYANAKEEDLVYQDLFEEARVELGVDTIYVLSDQPSIRSDWPGERGLITGPMIQQHVPDYVERLFFISGPQAMVTAYVALLRTLGIRRSQIKTDYFPGFA